MNYRKWERWQKVTLWVVIAVVILGTFTLIERPFTAQKKKYLLDQAALQGDTDDRQQMGDFLTKATPAEISSAYQYMVLYVKSNKPGAKTAAVPAALQTQVDALTAKYGIFG
jgi:hypothetical protein